MAKFIKIQKGLNIKLAGEAVKTISTLPIADIFAIKPPDFIDVIPKLLVKEGDEVKAGTPLFFDKDNEVIKFSSPVSGEIIEIVRGEKRKILEIKILADKHIEFADFPRADPSGLDRNQIIETLLSSGIWPFIRQRPFSTIANPDDSPKSIFISAFDTNPLAPDIDFVLSGSEQNFQAGLNALRKLTAGNVHLNIPSNTARESFLNNAVGVTINKISGPHPSGNVGIQIHHIDPINKGEVVWYVNPQDVVLIGKLFLEGTFDASRIIALTGSQVHRPQYYRSILGSSVKHILADGGLKADDARIISGSVLTGTKIPSDGFLGFYDSQISVIPEGNQSEFMGWIAPGFNKFSMSRTFFSWLNPNKKYDLDTNLHGEERPFVVTGEYEKVFPMDIYPVQLLKSILIEDIEMMENLGIYEVAEEDFALCEVVCTSKIKSQEIIRHGLDMIRKEFN